MIKKLSLHNPQGTEYIPLEDNNNYYYSYDLGLVASLLCCKHELTSIDKGASAKAMFIVKRTPKTNALISEYWNNSLKVDAQTMFNKIKRLKNQIYNP